MNAFALCDSLATRKSAVEVAPSFTFRGVAPARVINNPSSGERIVIRADAAETDGALLAFEVELPPGGHVPAGHAHPLQEEQFTVLEGQLRFRVGWRTRLLRRGDVVTVSPGTAHWFGNAGATVARARVEVRPALRMEELLATSGQVARHNPVQRLVSVARLLVEFHREVAVPYIPGWLMRLFLKPIARLYRA